MFAFTKFNFNLKELELKNKACLYNVWIFPLFQFVGFFQCMSGRIKADYFINLYSNICEKVDGFLIVLTFKV